MKIFLNNYRSGGAKGEHMDLSSPIENDYSLESMPVKLVRFNYLHIKLIFYYDILGKNGKLLINSLLKKL
jgi:hypothetical protein